MLITTAQEMPRPFHTISKDLEISGSKEEKSTTVVRVAAVSVTVDNPYDDSTNARDSTMAT
jgi:hypothetical protein